MKCKNGLWAMYSTYTSCVSNNLSKKESSQINSFVPVWDIHHKSLNIVYLHVPGTHHIVWNEVIASWMSCWYTVEITNAPTKKQQHDTDRTDIKWCCYNTKMITSLLIIGSFHDKLDTLLSATSKIWLKNLTDLSFEI